jgi:hypothetical protein
MVIAGSAVANTNLLVNGSFEQTFTDAVGQTLDATINDSFGYGGFAGTGAFMPGWNGDVQYGLAWNPTGTGGINPFGIPTLITSATDGNVVYGANVTGHFFGIYQNITLNGGEAADGKKGYKLTFDVNLSNSIITTPWLHAGIQFIDAATGVATEHMVGGVNINPGVTLNAGWEPFEVVVFADSALDGKQIQVYVGGGAGTFVDNVELTYYVAPPKEINLYIMQ